MSVLTSASITVEASIALPIFIFFCAALLGMFGVIEREINVQYALYRTCEEYAAIMPEAASVASEDDGLASAAGYIGAAALFDNYISGREGGVTVLSDCDKESGDITMHALYDGELLFMPKGMGNLPMLSGVQRHLWTGRYLADDTAGTDEQYVYVTENGKVYHTTAACTYLDISVRAADISAVAALRNDNGAKYYRCERCCKEEVSGTVYITDEGTRYHSDKDCGGIKRRYRAVPLSAVELPPCSRCGHDE